MKNKLHKMLIIRYIKQASSVIACLIVIPMSSFGQISTNKTTKPGKIKPSGEVLSVTTFCYPRPDNDCGPGGGGGTPPVLSTSTTTICTTQNDLNSNYIVAVLTASGCNSTGAKHAWYRLNGTEGEGIGHGSTSKTKEVSEPGTYFVRCMNPAGHISSSRSNFITIQEFSTPSDSPLLTYFNPINAGTTITLNATACSSSNYYWNNIGTGPNVVITTMLTDNYKATCLNNVCKGNSSSMTIIVLQPTITASQTTICYDPITNTRSTATLTMNNCNGAIKWSNGEITSAIVVKPNVTTTYSATCKAPNNSIINSNAINISVTPKPSVTKITLRGEDTQLIANCPTSTSYLWSTGVITSSIFVPKDVTQEYIVYCIKNGCYSMGTKTNIYQAPVISTNLNPICGYHSITLTAEGCEGTVSWYTSTGTTVLSTDNPYTFTPRGITTPTTRSYRANCTVDQDVSPYSNVLVIDINSGSTLSSPVVTSSPNPAIINLGTSISLTATGCAGKQTYWNTGEKLTTIFKSPIETTNYFAYCFDGTCPSNVVNKEVTVVDVAPPTLVATNSVICAGQEAHLNTSSCGGIVTLWSISSINPAEAPFMHGSGVNPNFNLTITESRIFYATCTNLGVVSDNSIMTPISFSPNPVIVSNPNPPAIWEGENIELVASGCSPGDTYLWDDSLVTQTLSQTESQSIYHTAKCVNATCTSSGNEVFVKVCPLLQTFVSPENDFLTSPINQPVSSKVLIASNFIKTTANPIKTKVVYNADNSIILEPGFMVEADAVFTAEIKGCIFEP